MNSVNEIFKLHIPFWLGKSYDLFKKNCNHFTKFFACLLLRTDEVVNFPEYVNRITIFAQYFSGFYKPIKKLYFENSSIISSINAEGVNNEAPGDNNHENNNMENNNMNNNEEQNCNEVNINVNVNVKQ